MRCKKTIVIIMVIVLSSFMFIESVAEEEAGPFYQIGMRADKSMMYTYEDMEKDVQYLESHYSDKVETDILGETYDGRNIYHMIIGRKDASNHILLFASIHGREYMTTQVLMRQAEEFLKQWSASEGEYKDIPIEVLMQDTAIHIIPMSNPDGVSISQLGYNGIKNDTTRQKIQEIAALDGAADINSYLRRWKSNAEGIDINRNFNALWSSYDDHVGHPSADHYKGESPGSTMEAKALINLTETYHFKRTISYHVQGEVIYWYFGQDGELKEDTKRFADEISQVTGYMLDANYENLDPAGYKDWAISEKLIPSLTIEVGKGEVPLSDNQLDIICNQNKDVWAATLYTLKSDI